MPFRATLLLEFAVLFVLMPLGFRYAPVELPPLPVLWVVAAYCWFVLRSDPTFMKVRLWNPAPLAGQLASIAACFAAVATLISASVFLFARPLLFSFIRTRPLLWITFMLLYPWLSVYPQCIVYRAFLMHRYAAIFPAPILLILMSASAFSFMHIIFRNPIAVGLTFFGGILFARRYGKTGSLATSAFEHALYGCFLFTIGLGEFFYHGRLAASANFLMK